MDDRFPCLEPTQPDLNYRHYASGAARCAADAFEQLAAGRQNPNPQPRSRQGVGAGGYGSAGVAGVR